MYTDYRWDMKRIKQGSLCIATETEATQGLYFLFNITEWEFFQDSILTKQMLEDES